MMGLQEIKDVLEKRPNPNDPSIIQQIRRMLDNNYFDPYEANCYGTGHDPMQKALPDDDIKNLKETVNAFASQPNFLRSYFKGARNIEEFLASSGTAGIGGAYYLVPDIIYGRLFGSAAGQDIVSQISFEMANLDGTTGSTRKVDIPIDGSFKFTKSSTGGSPPETAERYVQASLDLGDIYKGTFSIGNDLIEDTPFDVMERAITQAGKEAGEKASDLALTVLKTATDGDGTVNGGSSGDSAQTKWTGATIDVEDCIKANAVDFPHNPSDTMVVTYSAMLHSIIQTCGVAYNEAAIQGNFAANGWPIRLGGMNIIYSGCDTLTNTGADTYLVTIVFIKDFALLSARKRWLRIEQYSDPLKDLKGAVVTFRQDSVTYYDDSIAVITETA